MATYSRLTPDTFRQSAAEKAMSTEKLLTFDFSTVYNSILVRSSDNIERSFAALAQTFYY